MTGTNKGDWPLYEVFVRGKRGLNHVHVGSLHAADDRMALTHARDLYTRRYSEQPAGGEEYHLRHILVPFEGEGPDVQSVACAKAEAARAQLDTGRAFSEVAREFSAVNPQYGGDIGWLPLASVAPWMREALDGVPEGGTSEVLILPFGCSVLQLVERRVLEPVTFAQAKDPLMRELWERKLDHEYRSWIEELRKHSYIERHGYFAEAASLGADIGD